MPHPLKIVVLGKPQLVWQGQPLTADLISAKGQALLIYLAVTGQSCSRQAMAGLLWGDLPEERARGNLRFTLNKVRKVLGDYLLVTRQSLAFDFSQPHWLDAADFVTHCAAPQKASYARLQEAVALYQGDFLADFYLQDAPDFETWALVERERFQQLALLALFCLAETAQQRGEIEPAIAFTRRILSLEPWREEAHRHLMGLLALGGQRSAALNHFDTCRKILLEELGVEPSAETAALYAQIKQGELARVSYGNSAESGSAAITLAAFPTASRHNLPQPLTPFVGREAELAQIDRLLANPDCRLLTLVGPGGIGKTRLALTAAQGQLKNFHNNVYFVSLQGINPAGASEAVELLIAGIAGALAYTFSAPRAAHDLLLDYLANKELLLLLDNFEAFLSPRLQAREAITGLLLDMLQQAPGVKLLVTSRERLNLSPEWLVEVPGLPYPPTLARDAEASYPAARLFVQHARRIQPNFSPARQEEAVNRICQLVGGFPLGIELAANWVRLLSCTQIAARLEQNPDVAPDGLNNAAGPHASMRGVLDSSWAMLTEAEQQLFRRLAVFQGGFTLAAARQIASANLSLLNGLMNKSMLRRNEQGRYGLHELLSQYGAGRLAAWPPEEQKTRCKHSRFYASFLQTRRAALADENDPSALTAIDVEIENIRAAWEWLLTQKELETITPYLESLFLYYRRKGWFQEAVFALEQALTLEQASALQKGRWHRWLGEAIYNLGNLPESRRHLEQSLALLDRPAPNRSAMQMARIAEQTLLQGWQRIWPAKRPVSEQKSENRLEAARACERLCVIYWFQGQASRRLVYPTLRGLNLAEAAGPSPDLARAYATACVGLSHIPSPVLARLVPWHSLAQFYLRRALAVARSQSHPSALAWVLENTGLYWLRVGQWGSARVLLEEGAEIARQLGDGRRWEECVGLLGAMLSVQGCFAESLALQRETLSSARRRGDQQFQFHELSGMAENALRLGNLAEALDFLTGAEALLAGKHGLVEEIRYYGVLAQVRLQQADWAGARQAAQQAAERIGRAQANAFYSLEGYAGPAEVYLALWAANGQSVPEDKSLANSARQAVKALQVFGRLLPVGRPRAWLHQGLCHWLEGKPQQARRAWAKSLSLARRMEMPYEEARAYYELGCHLSPGDSARQENLARAAELFTRLGVLYDSGRVREALHQN